MEEVFKIKVNMYETTSSGIMVKPFKIYHTAFLYQSSDIERWEEGHGICNCSHDWIIPSDFNNTKFFSLLMSELYLIYSKIEDIFSTSI